MDSEEDIDSERKSPEGKRVRGAAKCKKITKRRKGDYIYVDHNDRGQPIGEGGMKLSSYYGLLAKSRVSINYEKWSVVPIELKDKLWEALREKFKLEDDERDNIMASMGECWKHFKSTLTRKYITPYRDEPEILQKPPEVYEHWIEDDWDEFVQSRLTEEFKETSNLNSERRAKKKYNHRISKKGYANLEEELKAELGPDYDPFDRGFKWKVAHGTKQLLYSDDATREVAEKIDELGVQVKEGNIVVEGKNDILTMALGTPEHSGRVRAVGKGLTPTTYFHIRRCSKKQIKELKTMLEEEKEKRKEEERKRKMAENKSVDIEKKLRLLEEKVDKLSQKPSTSHRSGRNDPNSKFSPFRLQESRKASEKFRQTSGVTCNNLEIPKKSEAGHGTTPSRPIQYVGKARKCFLAVDSKDNIVARGLAFEGHGPNNQVHGIDLGPKNIRVSIEKVIVGDAFLPIPVGDELVSIKDAYNSQVAWPKELVIYNEDEINGDHRLPMKPKAYPTTSLNAKGNGQIPSSRPMSNLGKARKCSLVIDSSKNIVAEGKAYEGHEPNHKVHGIELGPKNIRVSVDKVIVGDAFLPIPVGDELVFIKDAYNSQVAWPKERVIYNEDEISGDHRLPMKPKAYPTTLLNAKGNGQIPSSRPMSNLGKARKCSLAIDSRKNIVAEGKAYEGHGPNHKVHGIDLGLNNIRVSIDKVIVGDAFLPIPVGDELVIIKDAHNSQVSWPKELVIYNDIEVDPTIVLTAKTGLGTSMNKKRIPPKSVCVTKKDVQKEINDDAENKIRSFKKVVEESMTRKQFILIPIEREVFEAEIQVLNVKRNEVLDICSLNQINVSCIIAYMSLLYRSFESSRGIYGFASPAIFDHFGAKREQTTMLVQRLRERKRNQFIFLPYNPLGHWVLILIDVSSRTIYWLNSLAKGPSIIIQMALTSAVRAITIEEGCIEKNVVWEQVECPKQVGSVECGYYVMKMMKHFVEDSSKSLREKIKELGNIKTYSFDQLLEVRSEWIDYVQDFPTSE